LGIMTLEITALEILSLIVGLIVGFIEIGRSLRDILKKISCMAPNMAPIIAL
jgi:hypothetical protein